MSVKVGIATIIVVVLGATLFNYQWTGEVSKAIGENTALLGNHLNSMTLHAKIGADGLPINVTRVEFNKIDEKMDRMNVLLTAIAVKNGIDIGAIVQE